MRPSLPAFASGVLLLAAAAHAQGIAIDHKPVGCLVAGKFPKLDACFNPVSELARARAYFRATGAGSDWYYVEMKAGVPCYSGVLPKPKKALVGQTIEYYLDVSNRSLAEARTEEIKAYVVEKPPTARRRLLVAPLVNAATVVVYPAGSAVAAAVVPAGFASAAGLGAAATAAVVGGGVAVATGGVVAATQGAARRRHLHRQW